MLPRDHYFKMFVDGDGRESLGKLDPSSDSRHLRLHDWWQVTEIQVPHLLK